MLDKVLRMGFLYDFYGALLTEKQRQCLEMHYLSDLSLAEMAEQLGVTRQAVHDILRRAEQLLDEYETKLKLIERFQHEQQTISQVYGLISSLSDEVKQLEPVNRSLHILELLLDYGKEA
ncbi:YlxM family DNA-binding protein [Propionispora vibrioides]|uniref:UPF0122 protein SAMN04490178_10318 n=1 Tax=Propionispora vibrioides TaxID=112903 RepID=A0A1H8QPL2_9FIRM|nr:YlxM family DNA-binding protein [Propionispora vibrioides]SEO56132.1 hypothetical protein SAMN04490178_10318 [Propionispora vibrioides]